MKFVLLERVLNAEMELPLSPERFEEIGVASHVIFEMLSIEEKYYLLLQNYFDLERLYNELALRDMLFLDYDWSEKINDINTVNRSLMNLLSAAKTYLDHVPQHLNEIFRPGDEKGVEFNSRASIEYDSFSGYRVLSALRNHAQHGGFPVQSLSFGTDGRDYDGQRFVRHTVTAFVHVDSLAENKKFKADILADLKAVGDKFDLKPLTRQYMSSFARLHEWVREVTRTLVLSSDAVMLESYEAFRGAVNRKPSGLAAVKVSRSGEYLKVHGMAMHQIERRVHLERRSKLPQNTEWHCVSSDAVLREIPRVK